MTAVRTHLVYLLHFETKVGGKQHYCGITRADRLKTRLHEHVEGWGASLTKRVSDQGVPITLVRVWQTSDVGREKQIKRAGHLKNHCPICCGQPELPLTGYEKMTRIRGEGGPSWCPVSPKSGRTRNRKRTGPTQKG